MSGPESPGPVEHSEWFRPEPPPPPPDAPADAELYVAKQPNRTRLVIGLTIVALGVVAAVIGQVVDSRGIFVVGFLGAFLAALSLIPPLFIYRQRRTLAYATDGSTLWWRRPVNGWQPPFALDEVTTVSGTALRRTKIVFLEIRDQDRKVGAQVQLTNLEDPDRLLDHLRTHVTNPELEVASGARFWFRPPEGSSVDEKE